MFDFLKNIEYLGYSLFAAVSLLVLWVIMRKHRRPAYDMEVIYPETIMLMTNGGDDPCECKKEKFPLGDYLKDIDNFIVKDEEL